MAPPPEPGAELDRGPRDECGATLVELVISIVVISVAITGTLIAVDRAVLHSADPMIEYQSHGVAQMYLEEALLKPYYDPDLGAGGGACPAAEASRDLYDNVCDYAGIDDAGARDQDGNAIAGLAAYRVRVAVDTTATLNDLSGSADVLRVDVRVTHPPLVDLNLSGYRTRF